MTSRAESTPFGHTDRNQAAGTMTVPGTTYRILRRPGRSLRKAIFVQDDPIHLPRVVNRVLERFASSTSLVVIMPTTQGKRTVAGTALEFLRVFGFWYFLRKGVSVAIRRVTERLGRLSPLLAPRDVSVNRVCEVHDVPARFVHDVNSEESLRDFRELGIELLVSISGSQFYKRPLREQTPFGIINCHGALLPRNRGLMPSFWALANGDSETGVSVHYVDAKLDNGPIVVQRRMAILPGESLESLISRSKALAAECIVEAVEAIERGEPELLSNPEAESTANSFPSRKDRKRLARRGHRLS